MSVLVHLLGAYLHFYVSIQVFFFIFTQAMQRVCGLSGNLLYIYLLNSEGNKHLDL